MASGYRAEERSLADLIRLAIRSFVDAIGSGLVAFGASFANKTSLLSIGAMMVIYPLANFGFELSRGRLLLSISLLAMFVSGLVGVRGAFIEKDEIR